MRLLKITKMILKIWNKELRVRGNTGPYSFLSECNEECVKQVERMGGGFLWTVMLSGLMDR